MAGEPRVAEEPRMAREPRVAGEPQRGLFVFCVCSIFLIGKGTFLQTNKKQASGPGGNDRTRREAFNAPNESSVAALGASLVTKQAGRLPQHD